MPSDGAEAWANYFAGRAQGQEDRKDSLEKRGVAVLTTSGAFVTLLFGLVALVTDTKGYSLPMQARGPIGVALALLSLAALLGIGTNAPLRYKNVDDAAVRPKFDEYLAQSADRAHAEVAWTHLKIYAASSVVNKWKARILVASMATQLVGLIAVALAVREILIHG